MLTIRPEQMEIFRVHALIEFDKRLASHLRIEFPKETTHVSDDELLELIRYSRIEAERFGIKIEEQVACFVEFRVTEGKDWYEKPENYWAREILRDPDLKPGTKILQIRTGLNEG